MQVVDVYIEYSAKAVDRSFCYRCDDATITKGMRVYVDFASRSIVGFVVKVYHISEQECLAMPYELKPILSILDTKSLLNDEAFHLANYMSYHYASPLISCFQCMLPAKLKPQSSFKKPRQELIVVFVKEVPLKGKQQIAALEWIKEKQEAKQQEFTKQFSCLNKLKEFGCIKVIQRERQASFEKMEASASPFQLSQQQKHAINTIEKQVGYQVNLLHGVTGSGKTEVFLRLAKTTIDNNKQVLILVPEISLTPMMVERVRERFGEKVAIYHSGLNNQEKYEQFMLVEEKKVSIVVGTRSAIFMPFHNLGLMIMDEEHDHSYKQGSMPRYHCRDLLLERAKYHNCSVILASATPSLESYARAYKGKYHLLELNHRINLNMPHVTIIDMKEAMKSGSNYMLSTKLLDAIHLRLEKKQQVILLLNRRGYAPTLRCLDCGEVIKCPHCELPLNYHKSSGLNVCHICNFQEPIQKHCKQCGSQNMAYLGIGTQRLEEFVHQCFPLAKMMRMDADTTRNKGAHTKILKDFQDKKYDILLGTQMIAKGLDFENVSLVGIVNGDSQLAHDDFRSAETTFDLLVQASGRSGRGQIQGEVIVQVFDPNHYAVQCAKKQDYKQFFAQEMQFRHLASYPPYSFLSSMVLSGLKEDKVRFEMEQLYAILKEDNYKVLGPVALNKRQDFYRYRIIVKTKQEEQLFECSSKVLDEHTKRKQSSKLDIDNHPLYFE